MFESALADIGVCNVERMTPRIWLKLLFIIHPTVLTCIFENSERPVHLPDTSIMGDEAEQFTLLNNLPWLTDLITLSPGRTGKSACTPDFILTWVASLHPYICIHPCLSWMDIVHQIRPPTTSNLLKAHILAVQLNRMGRFPRFPSFPPLVSLFSFRRFRIRPQFYRPCCSRHTSFYSIHLQASKPQLP